MKPFVETKSIDGDYWMRVSDANDMRNESVVYTQEQAKATIDKDKMRFQAACAAMQGLLFADQYYKSEEMGLVCEAIKLADKLLQELEKRDTE